MSISISGDGTFTGVSTNYSFDQSVSVGGTVTYEDVTNVDSIGVITARSGVHYGTVGSGVTIDAVGAGTSLGFLVNGSERVRIDSSGRLLVGTSSTSGNGRLQVYGNISGQAAIISTLVTNATPADQSGLGIISFETSASSRTASITAIRDGGTWTNGTSQPSGLTFSTTADGASSPTERMRIASNGDFFVGKSAVDNTVTGLNFVNPTSAAAFLSVVNNSTASGARVVYLNRQGSDGNLIEFAQANSTEGVISVSGTSVIYGGGHLARWSQLLNEEDPSDILKGTVMSNLDEMCEWEGEDNEQLNKTKVSDVEGDPNVAGVFVSTSFDEVGPLDFFVGMTGDLIIRIAQGVTVQRGDLLMSAGDGTAKPQDDDIIRSKTIAKVTSTHVTCTYDDGSYCVPCVLMAC